MITKDHDKIDSLIHPRSIAVVGASDDPYSFGYYFIRCLLESGYKKRIYPVGRDSKAVMGIEVYPKLSSIPAPVDYVICCLPALRIPALLDECPDQGVKAVHVFSGRLSETGRKEAKDLEFAILEQAKEMDIRLIGPNCMGLYYPEEGISFAEDLPREPGKIGGLFQSGGLSILFARNGGLQGLRFSKVISYGNGLDLDECDFLEYFACDDETKVLVCYIEGIKNGDRFMGALKKVAREKPVIIMKGGRGRSGVRAALSHTAAISGSSDIWNGVFRQTGAILAGDLNEAIDLAVTFAFLPPLKGRRTAIMGSGGGRSVVSADICEAAGLSVPPLTEKLKDVLKKEAPEISDWIGNPIDASAVLPFISFEEVLELFGESADIDFVIVTIAEAAPLFREEWRALNETRIDAVISFCQRREKPIVVVMGGGKIGLDQFEHWRYRCIAALRSRLVSARIPAFSTTAEASVAISKLIGYYETRPS